MSPRLLASDARPAFERFGFVVEAENADNWNRTVVIYEAGARRTRLLAPTTGFLSRDPGFEEKFHTIRTWWVDHRGPDWVPVPAPRAQWDGPPAADGSPYAPPA